MVRGFCCGLRCKNWCGVNLYNNPHDARILLCALGVLLGINLYSYPRGARVFLCILLVYLSA
jgi:hypothetical protein